MPGDTVRHAGGFVVSGILAFTTDAAVLAAATRYLGIDPFTARLIAITVAMCVGYFAHRRFTFAMTTPPNWTEFTRFIGIASSAALLNYAVYAALLIAITGLDPLLALVGATAVAMAFSYLGYRFGVFRPPTL